MKNQDQNKVVKSHEVKAMKDMAKITKILKDIDKADKLLFELKQMAYQYSGNVARELIVKDPDYESISTMWNTLLEKRAELLAKVTLMLTKEY